MTIYKFERRGRGGGWGALNCKLTIETNLHRKVSGKWYGHCTEQRYLAGVII